MIKSALAIIGLIAAVAVFVFYTRPTYDLVRAEQATIAEYDAALEKASELQRLKQTLLSRLNAINPQNLERLQKFLPDHVDNVRLILDLDNMAARRGLALENVVIGAPGATAQQTAVGVIGAGRQSYESLTLTFSTTGTYTDFVGFIQDLESDLRLVDIVNLSLSRSGLPARAPASNPSAGTEPLFRYDISIRTYWLK